MHFPKMEERISIFGKNMPVLELCEATDDCRCFSTAREHEVYV
jgi:hypothetical protein